LAWTIEFQSSALNQLKKLDRNIQKRVLTFFRQRVLAAANPRQLGKALKGDRGELWRYRIGDYRAICRI